MAYTFYLTVKGKKQGDFKGESRQKGKIDILGFAHTITSPRDMTSSSGQASGKRQHAPLKVYKEWGPATTQFFEALVTGEDLTSVVIEAYNKDAAGKERLYFTITLTDATVSKLEEVFDDPHHPGQPNLHELEEISFVYHKIEVSNRVSNKTAADDWTAQSG